MRIEAEHNELVLRNTHGDTVVIPAEKRGWVKRKLRQGCHDCIDRLVATLPTVSRYAQDGSVIGGPKTFQGYQNIDPSKYETQLNPQQELAFQRWFEAQYQAGKIQKGDYQFYKQKGYGYDYDFRAAFLKGAKAQLNPEDKKWHWNDYGKKPNEPTFSDESKYHGVDGYIGGTWDEDTFSPPPQYDENTKKPDEPTAQDGAVVSGDEAGGPDKPYGKWLDPVIVSTKAPDVYHWSKDFLENNDHQKFMDEQMRGHEERFYDPNVPEWARQVAGGYNDDRKAFDRTEDEKLFEQKRINYIAQKLLQRTPSPEDPYKSNNPAIRKKLGFATAFSDENPNDRLDWLKKFSPAEIAVLMRADDPTVMSAVRPTPMQDFRNTVKGGMQAGVGQPMTPVEGTTYEEQIHALMNWDKSLAVPLSTAGNAVIQMGDNDANYSIKDVFQGRPSGAGFWKQTLNDPLTYAGMGLGRAAGRAGVAKTLENITAEGAGEMAAPARVSTRELSAGGYEESSAWGRMGREIKAGQSDITLTPEQMGPGKGSAPDLGELPPAPPQQIAPWQQVGYYEKPPDLVPKPWGEDKELDKIRQVYWGRERPLTDVEKKRLLAEGLGDTPSIGILRDDYFSGYRELRPEEMKRLEEEGVKYMTPEQIEMLKSAGFNPRTPKEIRPPLPPVVPGEVSLGEMGNLPPADAESRMQPTQVWPANPWERIRLHMNKREGIGLQPWEWQQKWNDLTPLQREELSKKFTSLNTTIPAIATGAATAVAERMQKRKKSQ